MYEELVKALRGTDFSDGCPCEAEAMCKEKDCVIAQAADAIEELDTLLDGVSADNDALCETIERLKAIVIAEAQHTEMYDERDKKTLIEMAKSLPLQIIPYNDEKPRWIPVTERLPEEDGEYLTWFRVDDSEPSFGIFPFDANVPAFGYWEDYYDPATYGWAGSDFIEVKGVTHWIPLPDPPKEETE